MRRGESPLVVAAAEGLCFEVMCSKSENQNQNGEVLNVGKMKQL